MKIQLSELLLSRIAAHGETAYPEEGAGFLLGTDGAHRTVREVISVSNARQEMARRTRYLIEAQDYLEAELEAERRGIDLVGVFHSHPDHPCSPSAFDLEWAQPRFSYVITSVRAGRAAATKSWRLDDDRRGFTEEAIEITT